MAKTPGICRSGGKPATICFLGCQGRRRDRDDSPGHHTQAYYIRLPSKGRLVVIAPLDDRTPSRTNLGHAAVLLSRDRDVVVKENNAIQRRGRTKGVATNKGTGR